MVLAELARQLQDTVGLTTTSLLGMSSCNGLKNCTVSRKSVVNAIKIWGPSKTNLQDTTNRSSAEAFVVNEETVHLVLPKIIETHVNVSVGMDIMKVNGILFLVTISTVLHYATFYELEDLKMNTIANDIKKMVKIYR